LITDSDILDAASLLGLQKYLGIKMSVNVPNELSSILATAISLLIVSNI